MHLSYLRQFVLIAVAVLMTGQIHAAPAASKVEVQPATRTASGFDCYGHPESQMRLVVTGGDPDTKIEDTFCAANKPTVAIVTDKRGREYVLLDYAERGPSAIDDVLRVYRLDKRQLFGVLATHLSCARNLPSLVRDKYVYAAKPSTTGGLELTLQRDSSATAAGETHSRDDLHCEEGRTFAIDPEPSSPHIDARPDTRARALKTEVLGTPFLRGTTGVDREPCGFREDLMTLEVADREGGSKQWVFCSGYGAARAWGFVDKADHKFIVLEYRQGHGTGIPRALSVYRLEKEELFEIMRTELGWWTGVSVLFTYEASAEIGPTGGLAITFRGSADNGKLNLCCIPSEMNRTVWIDP